MNPKYHIYIISKGRWESNYTARTLEYMGVPYTLVVEPQEYVKYAQAINSKKILVTPFSNLGQGSIPVRNFVWEHALKLGVKRYWVMDDNIKLFYRYNHNKKVPVNSGTILKCAEDFVDRYQNIGLAGLQYDYFIAAKERYNPIILNTRIYSCILIDTSLKLRWRGKYNEDTDLSIRVLQSGLCTVLFMSFLCGKVPTLNMKGGNTSTIYNTGDERKEFAESLKKQHPDIVEVIRKYNRWHHKVDYSGFKNNQLVPVKGFKPPNGQNEYGMKLITFKENQTIFKDEK